MLALFASLITLVFLEIAARVYVTRFADREQFSRYASLRQYRARIGAGEWWFGLFAPHRYLGFIGVPNLVDGKNRHNSLGFRGDEIAMPKPAGEFRIACLGASTTYDILVPDYHLAYPVMLQNELRSRGYKSIAVINAGIPAWTSYEVLINYLLRAQDLDLDLIIINQAFADVISRFVWPPEAYRGDNSGYFAPGLALREPPVYEASALLRILLVKTGNALPASAFGKSVYNEADTSYFLEFARQRFAGRFPSGIFERISPTDMLAANPPWYFRRNVEDLVISAKRRGVQPVLMTFEYSPRFPAYFGVPGFQSAVDEHNEISKEVARALQVPMMDLAPAFPTEERYWGPDGIHVNAEGAALKASLVADFLIQRELVPN